MSTAIPQYLSAIQKAHSPGNATEHTYRPAFQKLVESFAKNITATNEPKRIACGAPDFIVNLNGAPVGYIECKDVGESLDKTEKTDQLKRYFSSLGNLILTDYLEFRYYISGQPTMQVVLARCGANGKITPLQGAEEHLTNLFTAFFQAQTKTIATPKELAARMANIAKVIRDAIERAFELEGDAGTLHGEYESFRATILTAISPKQFADMYAQTVCYGMFSARVNVPDDKAAGFTREHAAYDLPATNPFLREVFDYIAGTRLDPSIVWAVDLLADILRRCDMAEILAEFGKAIREEDPVVHFYETFLAAYDPALRESRGVYYTPEPVVGYIVRSIDAILKRDFACPDGLTDHSKVTVEVPDRTGGKKAMKIDEVHRVQILDPATGTGTFLYSTIRHIHESLGSNKGSWAGKNGYVAQHLLPRVFGFELMMAPYAVAHMKLGWLLKETGYDFAANERLRVYLTNTLEEAEVAADAKLLFANQIAREANAASQVKSDAPIMVVLGNPPYSGHSANKNQWSKDLIKKKLAGPHGAPGYFECDGQPLGERNPKWINNDYVKFIRFAQARIERTGYGILGFITDHGYLDNPTFRGMRQSLMHTFDDIHILDLHGATKKNETAPDGSKDENVFDIMQGVTISLFIKRVNGATKKPSVVYHAELFGSRESKYQFLDLHSFSDTKWKLIVPRTPNYMFIPQKVRLLGEYNEYTAMSDIYPVQSVGVVTGQDANAIGLTAADAKGLALDVGLSVQCVTPHLYRPFDRRFIVYHPQLVTRNRIQVMSHMLSANVGLICTRQTRDKWDVFSTNSICGHKTCSAYDINSLFPIYLYPDSAGLFNHDPGSGMNGRRPNLAPEFIADFGTKLNLAFVPDGSGDLKQTFGPEDVFHYAYAIFHNPTYRSRYAQFLKIDFPRLPLTGDCKLFARLCALGKELVGLHLLEQVPNPQATYPQAGSNEVEKPRYVPPAKGASGRVYVNAVQYFDDVLPEVWEFHVGGYQVCEKWLKDRRGRTLSFDDIQTYRKITESLRQTIRLMAAIDTAIPAWPITG